MQPPAYFELIFFIVIILGIQYWLMMNKLKSRLPITLNTDLKQFHMPSCAYLNCLAKQPFNNL